MKVIIAGGRYIQDQSLVEKMASCINITKVISGGAKGVDKLGEIYASKHNIPYVIIKADWEKYGRSAGAIRNRTMAENADALIAIWDGKSKGTKDMINQAYKKGLKVIIYMDQSLAPKF